MNASLRPRTLAAPTLPEQPVSPTAAEIARMHDEIARCVSQEAGRVDRALPGEPQRGTAS